MFRQSTYVYFVFVIFMFQSYASYGQISGQVFDEDGLPIPGAHVRTLQQKIIGISDIGGYFSIQTATYGDTLIISHVAYDSDTLHQVGKGASYLITLKSALMSLDNLVITPDFQPYRQLVQARISNETRNSSQDLLQLVPGLFIGQHAGGGKAEQMFLRGFDLDHGTDIAIAVDNMPVNIVSHAHGQGYADLHFVIPELIERIDYGKGPYDVRFGNFNTAGHVAFRTKSLVNDQIQFTYGQFGTKRLFGAANLLNSPLHQSYVAGEAYFSDGPFESPQGLRRLNLVLKERWQFKTGHHLGARFMAFRNEWTASGQIPERLVREGTISRFGAVDDTEGGTTSRRSVSLDYGGLVQGGFLDAQIDYIHYDFDLFSNFSFFLNDPVNGDQIRQMERRNTIHGLARYRRNFALLGPDAVWHAGLNFRDDRIPEILLSRTLMRKTLLERVQWGAISERNVGGYVGAIWDWDRFSFAADIRMDHFDFSYSDQINRSHASRSDWQFSPKMQVSYDASDQLRLMFKVARGFHSNDSRLAGNADSLRMLPAAHAADFGLFWRPSKLLFLDLNVYTMLLESELVYVGDEGVVEPSLSSLRKGVEIGLKLEPVSGLFFRAEWTYAHARFSGNEGGENYIPLAPVWTRSFGVDYIHKSGFKMGIDYRSLSDRPANENYSLTATGYSIASMKASYGFQAFEFGVEIQNLFDVAWNETQFATESRLADELQPVEEIHFTPGTPFFFKGSLSYRF